MKTISVNIMQHGSNPGLVYIQINTDGVDIVLNAEQIHVRIDERLPNPFNENAKVTVWQNAK